MRTNRVIAAAAASLTSSGMRLPVPGSVRMPESGRTACPAMWCTASAAAIEMP